MKRYKILSIILCLSGFTMASLSAQNTSELDRAVKNVQNDECMRHASLSINVYNITKKKNIYSHDAQRALIPASMNKIFTTAIAFDQLGSDFRFKTSIA